MRRVLAVLLAPVLLFAFSACSDEAEPEQQAADSIDAVQVKGKAGAKPSLEFEKPYKANKTESKVVADGVATSGAGEPVEKGDAVVVDYVGVNARDGKEFDSSWAENRPPALFTLEDGSLIKGFVSGLVGKKIGDRVLISIPAKDGYPQGNPDAGIKKGDTLLFVVDLLMKPAASAQGTPVEPEAGLPEVQLDEQDRPQAVKIPKENPPEEPVTQPLIKGDGAKVEAVSTIAVHLLGANWRTGEVVESSWAQGQPYVLPVAGLFEGLKNGLVGQTGGSRVEIVVPPEQGFGEDIPGTDVKKDDTLVFVVDIVGVL